MTRASSTTLFLLFAETIAAANLIAASPSKGSELPARRAIHHLAGRMDVFRPVHVYRDFGWGGNADFIPSGWMGDTGNLEIDEQWTDGAEDETCILINYRGTDWAGIYWQRPENNWGKSSPRSGRDLRPARKLKLRAKAHQKDCTVEIGMAGIDGPYGDSSQKRSKPLRLTAQWQDYEVDLGGMDLKHIVGGFLVVFKDSASICLDNIRYDTDRPVEATRLVPSYLVTRRSALYPVNNNAAHLYDNALIMIAFSCEARNGKASPEDKRDSSNRLRILADATLASLQHDRAFTDGRLRNAYWGGGDFLDHTGHVRLPGWYDRNQRQWLEDRYCVSSYTGNLAWAALGLLEASHTLEPQKADGKYLLACQQIMSWIDKNTRESDELGGFSGGVEGWEANDSHPGGPERIQWRSTEHNLDVLAVAKRLAVITKDERWGGMAAHAARFLKHTFNAEGSHFWTGTLPSGQINQNTIPLDCQTWAVLAASDKATDRRALTGRSNIWRLPSHGPTGMRSGATPTALHRRGSGRKARLRWVLPASMQD